jgi:hypothetical protein
MVYILLVVMLLWGAPDRGAAQTQPASAVFDGTESILDPLRHEQIIGLSKIASSATAAGQLLALVQDYNRLIQNKGAATFKSQIREWGERKVAFYKTRGLLRSVMGVAPEESERYISRWRTYWAAADRIEAAERAKVIAAVNKRVNVNDIRALPAVTQALARLDPDSPQADAALLASPNVLGASPDDLKSVEPKDDGCQEYYHVDGIPGGGYTVDRTGLLLDRCEANNTKLREFYCPDAPQAMPTATPTPDPAGAGVVALSRVKNCTCQTFVSPVHKHETARCL